MILIRYILIGCLTVIGFQSLGQNNENVFKNLLPQPIKSISSTDNDFEDLKFFKEVLKDNRIVLLGEQSHGEGSTFAAKVRLIKYLHQELGYEILSFESGLYDNFKAYESISDSNYWDSPLKESIFRIWSETKEFEPLLKYIHDQKGSDNPLMVTGFDCQADELFKSEFLDDIISTLKGRITLSEGERNILDQVITSGPELIVSNELDSLLFFATCDKVQSGLEKLIQSDPTIKLKILKQSMISWIEMMKWEMDILNDVPSQVQNPRDLQMARNLLFLSQLYPEKKIIGWGASYHFANQIELHENTTLTQSYTKKYDSMLRKHEPTDLEFELAGAVPMGKILKNHFGPKIYSLTFSSFEGEFGMLGSPSISLKPLRPPLGSVEYTLDATDNTYSFVDYRDIKNEAKFYSSALGNVPILAPWQKIFDGLFFIKVSNPPSFPDEGFTSAIHPSDNKIIKQALAVTKNNSKSIVNQETGQGIGYANIYLVNSSKGVASNAEGEFTFNVSAFKKTDKIVCSSIGFRTDTLAVQEFLKKSRIELIPIATQLGEIEIRSRPLRAKEIIKLAEKKISENFYQLPHQQEFFYRVNQYHESSEIFNEEAAVLVYSQNGYKPSINSYKNLKGKILQFRNTTNNEDNRNSWAGIGSLWLMYTHDLVLDKDNVLHRPAYYDLTLNGITIYENRKVYEISFECKRPGSYTTGFGYPSPLSAKGIIFIDANTYAVLKVETIIQRQSYKSKRRPNFVINPYGHHLIQTYKEFNGKYFLNFSKQVHFSLATNTLTNASERNLEIRELLSTDITINSKEQFTVPLIRIKSQRVVEDSNFWEKHNIKLEDDIEKSYELLGIRK